MKDILSIIKSVPEFAEVPEQELQWLIDQGEVVAYDAGDFIAKKGDPANFLLILLSGKVRFYLEQNMQQKEINLLLPGSVTGLLPYSRMKETMAFGQVVEKSEVLLVHKDKFNDMICFHHGLTESLVHLMTSRVRSFTVLQQQNEKLLSLGKLSAGLAHELNNPASAIGRSSISLQNHLSGLSDRFKELVKINATEEQIDAINEVIKHRKANPPLKKLSIIERSDCEDVVIELLENANVTEACELAENLVDHGFISEELEKISSIISPAHFPAVMKWINTTLVADKLIKEIVEASKRIGNLVGSVKSYTYMDTALDKQEVDIHEGIRNTVVMLNHKFRKNKVGLTEKFDPNLKKIKGFPGELNQVWTNIIDNALDAMEEKGGGLEILTSKQDDKAKILFIDNGPGIPKEILDRIFEPFFTTKDIGKGSGMGLDIVQKIVQQHRAVLTVDSEPGKTTFAFTFPINS